MIQCPLCKVPILRTLRFNKQTKTAYKDLTKIKYKLLAQSSGTEEMKKNLLESIKSLEKRLIHDFTETSTDLKIVKQHWDNTMDPIRNALSRKRRRITFNEEPPMSITVNDIHSLNFVVRFAESYFTYLRRVECISDAQLRNAAIKHFTSLWKVALKNPKLLTAQQKIDIDLEMARGGRLVGMYETQTNAAHVFLSKSSTAVEAKDLLNGMKSLLTTCEPYDRTKDVEVQRLGSADRIKTLIGSCSKTTDKERKMIHAAMSSSFTGGSRVQGHWLKCENGHTYCVTECGGPTQTARCPECGVNICGLNHRYVAGTTVAAEMDGASVLHGARLMT